MLLIINRTAKHKMVFMQASTPLQGVDTIMVFPHFLGTEIDLEQGSSLLNTTTSSWLINKNALCPINSCTLFSLYFASTKFRDFCDFEKINSSMTVSRAVYASKSEFLLLHRKVYSI